LRFFPKVKLSADETDEIKSLLEQLKSKLRRLGEEI